MSTQKGIGIVWGSKIDGVVYGAAATALQVNHTGQSFSHQADFAEHLDDQGEVTGLTLSNVRKELTLRCYPSDTTIAAAKTANVLPSIGDEVTVTDADDSDIAGGYNVVSVSKEKEARGKVTFDITLRQHNGGALTNVAAA